MFKYKNTKTNNMLSKKITLIISLALVVAVLVSGLYAKEFVSVSQDSQDIKKFNNSKVKTLDDVSAKSVSELHNQVEKQNLKLHRIVDFNKFQATDRRSMRFLDKIATKSKKVIFDLKFFLRWKMAITRLMF
jgi:Na+-transporting NADH:ubiquinone oxidoreductase subunit NqrC